MQWPETIYHHPPFQPHFGVYLPTLPIFSPPGSSHHSLDAVWVFIKIWALAQAVLTTSESLSLSSAGFCDSWFIQQTFGTYYGKALFKEHGIYSEQNSPSLRSWSLKNSRGLNCSQQIWGMIWRCSFKSLVTLTRNENVNTYDCGGFRMSL